MADSISTFRRHVKAAASTLRHIERSQCARNAGASERNVDFHVNAADAILRAACHDTTDPLPDYLDSPRGQRLSETWNQVERQAAGLYA